MENLGISRNFWIFLEILLDFVGFCFNLEATELRSNEGNDNYVLGSGVSPGGLKGGWV